MKKSILVCLTALVLLATAAPSGGLAQSGQGDVRVVPPDAKVVARVKDARTKNRRVTINFRDGASVTGRVGEVREQGFTFEPDGLSAELKRQNAAAVILFDDVDSVQHPSKVRSFFKKVGYGLALGGAYAVVAPMNGVTLLLFGSTIPGCP
jgi:hypothetical protein